VLLGGIGLIVVAAQFWAVAFLADLQATNRRVLEDLRLRARRVEYGDASPGDESRSE
jgi:hypothetical protein